MIGKGIKTGWSVSTGGALAEGPGLTFSARLNLGEVVVLNGVPKSYYDTID
jgi:hypothetical protein